MAKKDQKNNKIVGIGLILIANIFLSVAIARIVVADYVQSNPGKIIDVLQKYSENQGARESQESGKIGAEVTKAAQGQTSDPVIGNPKGTKVLVEFFDYNCGYCRHTFPEIMKLVKSDSEVKVVFKEFPILSPTSQLASVAALAVNAKQPEKYLEFHQKLMEFKEEKNVLAMVQIGKEIGLNFDLNKEMDNPEYTKIITANRELGQSLGINGTPSFVIRGHLIPGAIDEATMEKLLNAPAGK